MNFLAMLLLLALRRFDFSWSDFFLRAERHKKWLARMGENGGIVPWCLLVAAPSVLFFALTMTLGGFWGQLFLLLITLVAMLWLMGVQSEFRHVDELLIRGAMRDEQGFEELAKEAFGVEQTTDTHAYKRDLGERVLEKERDSFLAFFWLIVLGPGAVWFVVMHRQWCRQYEVSSWQQHLSDGLVWPVQRLMILCMALAGDYVDVMTLLHKNVTTLKSHASDLLACAHAALGLETNRVTEQDALTSTAAYLEALQSLQLRCMALWLMLGALWVLLL